jgi:glycosyltransferase involved in cell wall biosynthesis
MRIFFYCPDRHIRYDGASADRTGAGGGLTVRIRMSAALARRGHAVTVACNCPLPAVHNGVQYLPLDEVKSIHCDALVMHSSGGAHDMSALLSMPVEARVRIDAISGIGVAKGVAELAPDAFYVCSNFLRGEILRFPGVVREKLFVSYHGVSAWNRPGWLAPARDPRRLLYSSHPSKGFDAAREVLRRLRARDPRFTLRMFGGNQLWGGPEAPPPEDPGIVYGGLIDQRRLAGEYQRAGFSVQLQTRPEPFGITVAEAMAGGCLVVASPVGSLAELVRNGDNGFLVEGDPADPGTVERAAGLIRSVSENPALMEAVRRRASAAPLSWDTVAEVWETHLSWLADGRATRLEAPWARCLECRAPSLILADGYHCPVCGYYARSCAPWPS